MAEWLFKSEEAADGPPDETEARGPSKGSAKESSGSPAGGSSPKGTPKLSPKQCVLEAVKDETRKRLAEFTIPAMRRVLQNETDDGERNRLKKEIGDLQSQLEILSGGSPKHGPARDRMGAPKFELEPTDAEEPTGPTPKQQRAKLDMKVGALLLPGLKRMHSDANNEEDRNRLFKEIEQIEALQGDHDIDSPRLDGGGLNIPFWSRFKPDDNWDDDDDHLPLNVRIDKKIAHMLKPALKHMYSDSAKVEHARLDEWMAIIEKMCDRKKNDDSEVEDTCPLAQRIAKLVAGDASAKFEPPDRSATK